MTFHLLTDQRPPYRLPANVIHHNVPVAALMDRMRKAIGPGFRLRAPRGDPMTATADRHNPDGSTMSGSKMNDLKPMLGVAFADILRPYGWWGWVQEDVLVGDLRRCLPPNLLADSDVICPFSSKPSSGVMMLFRNNEYVNNLWSRSRDKNRVISNATYMVRASAEMHSFTKVLADTHRGARIHAPWCPSGVGRVVGRRDHRRLPDGAAKRKDGRPPAYQARAGMVGHPQGLSTHEVVRG